MSDLARATEVMSEAQRLAAHTTEELAAAYAALFFGTPSKDDQAMVRADLEKFCGMNTDLMRATFHETANAVGRFRVWQRIVSFCQPRDRRPPDAQEGERHGQADQDHNRPLAGGGVAEQTVD